MYTETTATSVEDLLDQIAVAAAAEGWTVERNDLVGSNRTVTLRMGVGDYIHLWNTTVDHFYMRGSTGYDGGLTPDNQPNVAPYRAQCNCYDGPFSDVYFFADASPADHFHVVINIDGIRYRHASFGTLVKFGAYTGGTYYDALNYDDGNSLANDDALDPDHHVMFSCGSNDNSNAGSVRIDADGRTDYWAPFRNPQATGMFNVSGGFGSESTSIQLSYGDSYRTQSAFYARSINAWSGRTPMQHIQIRHYRGATYYSPIGEVPNIRYLNMTRFVAAEEVTIGSDVWKIFPWVKQGGAVPHSSQHAFAYKKVP